MTTALNDPWACLANIPRRFVIERPRAWAPVMGALVVFMSGPARGSQLRSWRDIVKSSSEWGIQVSVMAGMHACVSGGELRRTSVGFASSA